MRQIQRAIRGGWGLALTFAMAIAACAQQPGAGLQGRVTDQSGAIVPAAVVTVTGETGYTGQLVTDGSGAYAVKGLAPGRYVVRVTRPGFGTFESPAVDLTAGSRTINVQLKLQAAQQRITVEGMADALSTDPSANAGALILKPEDLEALSDDPDELLAELKALAGPPSGLKGSQLYVDGFKAGRLPPKESIREIRINQNPFSAEYDRMGLGRIEVFTKPGSEKFHGMLAFRYSTAALNSRNPYSSNKPPYYSEQVEGNLAGPLGKRVSFFTDFEQRSSSDNAVIHATVLDPALRVMTISQAIVTPRHETTFGQRFDVQLARNHTLMGRYALVSSEHDNSGIGSFELVSHGHNTFHTEHIVQMTETAVLGPRAVNETRFQFRRNHTSLAGDNSEPTIVALDAFTGGGDGVGNSFTASDHYEVQNYTSYAAGTHMLKFGVRLLAAALTDYSVRNFAGTFTFAGGLAPELDDKNRIVLDASGSPVLTPITSLESYRRTLIFRQLGLTASAIRARGGGASQFSVTGGQPQTGLTETEAGVFIQHDWRARPGFTLSTGMRYEVQNHIHDWTDVAPRLGFAWAPGARRKRPAKTLIRGGAGFFYDRFGQNQILQTMRFDGVTQQRFVIHHPDFFPNVPSLASLEERQLPQTIWQMDRNLRAPRVMQSAIGVERQLPFQIVLALTYIHSRAVHSFLSRNINAPLPGTFQPDDSASGLRPYGPNNIFQHESDGILNQNQIHLNMNRRFTGRFAAFGYYSYNRAFSNTDGSGSFPANQYSLRSEYGRADGDIRHQFVLGSSLLAPFRLSLSPFVLARSGAPFNIVTGSDANGDSLFNDRPSFAANVNQPGVIVTRFGAFEPNPGPGELPIPRNFGQAPSYFNLNLRVSRTFGLGSLKAPKKKPKRGSKNAAGEPELGMTLGADENSLQQVLQESRTEHKYNLTLSVTARNILNHVNPGIPIGNVSSPLFGSSNWLASSSGPEDEATGNNRRILFRVRIGF